MLRNLSYQQIQLIKIKIKMHLDLIAISCSIQTKWTLLDMNNFIHQTSGRNSNKYTDLSSTK